MYIPIEENEIDGPSTKSNLSVPPKVHSVPQEKSVKPPVRVQIHKGQLGMEALYER